MDVLCSACPWPLCVPCCVYLVSSGGCDPGVRVCIRAGDVRTTSDPLNLVPVLLCGTSESEDRAGAQPCQGWDLQGRLRVKSSAQLLLIDLIVSGKSAL